MPALFFCSTSCGTCDRFLRGLKVQREQKKRSKIQELYTKGLNALLAKRGPEAITFFQRVLNLDPNHVDTLLRMGITQLRQKNVQEAIRLHLKAWNLESNNQEVMFSLSADYEEAKRFDEAIKMYREILRKDPSNITTLIRLRDLYHRLNQWEELIETQARLLANPLGAQELEVEHRKLIGFKYELGRSQLEAGDLERAKKVFRGVIKLDKDFVPAYLGLGEVYLEEGKQKEAGQLWEKSYKLTSSVLLAAPPRGPLPQTGGAGERHRDLQAGGDLETAGHDPEILSRETVLSSRNDR